MMTEPNGSTLDTLRAEIDVLDERIVALLAQRTAVVGRVGALKRRQRTSEDGVRALDRVERVVERIRGLAAEQGMDPAIAEQTYRALITALTDMQLEARR
jgi:isochorismate pyruvate lyase